MRSELESQGYLLEKLLSEEIDQESTAINNDNSPSSNTEIFRFEGINDSKSIDEVYDEGIAHLNEKNYKNAKQSFNYLVDNFDDQEKIPLSLFGLVRFLCWNLILKKASNFFKDWLQIFLIIGEHHWLIKKWRHFNDVW